MEKSKQYAAYILRCSDGTLYTGYAANVARRLQTHNSGKGAKYTRARLPVELLFSAICASRGQAQSLEAKIKRLSRAEKLLLIATGEYAYLLETNAPTAVE